MLSLDRSAAFAAIASDLHAESDEQVTGRTIVTRMLGLVPGAERVSLTLQTRGKGHATLAATDELAERADALQYRLGEGPCVQTADEGHWIRSGDVGRDHRWPRWGPRASELGIGSLLSVRLLERDQPHGSLTVYSGRAGQFADSDTVDLAVVYAVHAANALASARLVSNLQTALSSRHSIGMAQGMLMERYGLSEHQSFELLRRVSASSESKLRDVAVHVVETGGLPESDSTGTDELRRRRPGVH